MLTPVGGSVRRSVLLVAVAVGMAAACSGSDDATTSTDIPGVSTDAGDDPFSPIDVDQPVVVPVTLDDDVIIGTDDGSVPTSTTEPPTSGTPDEPPPVDSPTTTAPVIALPDPADVGRIVSLSPTHTETLFALGLGDFVVAVDAESDFPLAALAVRDPALGEDFANIDPLVAFDPDVVIVGDDPTGVVGRLNAAGIASYSGPRPESLADVFTQIRDIAAIVGRPELAEQLISKMQSDIDAIVATLPPGAVGAGLTFFHEIDPSLFTLGNDAFLSNVYSTLGLTNIAGPGDAAEVTQMTNDAVIAADPDVIVLADAECCAVTKERLATRPGWANVSAVRDGAVVEITDPLALRWGPRVVDLLRLVAGGVAAAAG
jgi:iron complex transport system substrate-binding protein